MKRKISALLLTPVLIVALLSALAIMTGASTPTPELDIAYCNLSFRDSVCIKYAVSSNVEDVKILIWTSPEDEYTVGTQDDEITKYYKEEIDGNSHMIFDYTALSAKQMTDVVYARAYSEADGVGYYSEVNKYSILQYAYNMLGKTETASTDSALKEMLTNMLIYGASAQKYLNNYKTDRLATADWYQVKLTAGVLGDGCTHGLYLPEDKVTMTAPAADANGATFAYWSDSEGNKVATTATYELTVGNANKIYTPVYVKYSSGLEFDSNGDGTCCLIGIGDFSGKELIIPPTSPDGDRVTEIDSSVFSGEPLTGVSFPSTIESIGRRAFNGCTSITDVYYDGSEAKWAEVSISSGNDPILNAKMHYTELTLYTVDFLDHSGALIKSERVVSGKSATAPKAPDRVGYTFIGWDTDFSCVTMDLVVRATYIAADVTPTFVVSNEIASAGDSEVKITIALRNNPGIASIKLMVKYAQELTLTGVEYNTAIGGMSQQPQTYDSPVVLNWFDGARNAEGDWVFATLTFAVAPSAVDGDYSVEITYDRNDVYDITESNIEFNIINGSITVS